MLIKLVSSFAPVSPERDIGGPVRDVVRLWPAVATLGPTLGLGPETVLRFRCVELGPAAGVPAGADMTDCFDSDEFRDNEAFTSAMA